MKALFFDLDNTLLDSSKKIPPSARDALRQARAKGVKIYLATARSPRLGESLGWTDAEFSLFDGGIYSNGGYVEAQGLSRYAFIDPQVVAECVQAVQEHGSVHLSLHSPGHGYTFNFPLTPSMAHTWGVTEENLRPLNAATMAQTAKMLIFWRELVGETQLLPPSLCQCLETLCRGRARLYVTDKGAAMQLTALEAGKLTAIRSIQAQLGLANEDVGVFGDDLNDVDMLAHYPNSVAMGNGAPQALAAAAHVTRSCDEDGIAWALKNILHII